MQAAADQQSWAQDRILYGNILAQDHVRIMEFWCVFVCPTIVTRQQFSRRSLSHGHLNGGARIKIDKLYFANSFLIHNKGKEGICQWYSVQSNQGN